MNAKQRELRLESNPIEGFLWQWTLCKIGLKILALLAFAVYCIVKIACK